MLVVNVCCVYIKNSLTFIDVNCFILLWAETILKLTHQLIRLCLNFCAESINANKQSKISILYSQFLRLCRDVKDFVTESLEMRAFFVERGYPTHLLDSAIRKAFNNSRRDTLKPSLAKISDNKMPLVLIFHPLATKLGTSLAVIF